MQPAWTSSKGTPGSGGDLVTEGACALRVSCCASHFLPIGTVQQCGLRVAISPEFSEEATISNFATYCPS